MATVQAVLSYTLQDAKGERFAIPIYITFDDATETLAALVSDAQAVATQLDALTEAQITRMRVILNEPLPGGLKVAPVANSDNEETGLLTYLLVGNPKSYGQDIPAFDQSKFIAGNINLADADVSVWTTNMQGGVGGLTFTNQVWSNALDTVRSGRKTFRKHRRQASRT